MSADSSDDAFDDNERQRIWDEANARATRRAQIEQATRRALIEQAKGTLMFIYGIDADEAFDILRRQSQQHNIKVGLIAEQIMKDLVELTKPKGPERRVAFDGLMLTAHQRITHVAARQLDGQRKTGIPMKDL